MSNTKSFKIVLDTNSLYKLLFSDKPSGAMSILKELIRENRVTLVFSPILKDEITQLIHGKVSHPDDRTILEGILDQFIESGIYIQNIPSLIDPVQVSPDESDNAIGNLAIYTNADYLITDNLKDFFPNQKGDRKKYDKTYFTKIRVFLEDLEKQGILRKKSS